MIDVWDIIDLLDMSGLLPLALCLALAYPYAILAAVVALTKH